MEPTRQYGLDTGLSTRPVAFPYDVTGGGKVIYSVNDSVCLSNWYKELDEVSAIHTKR